MTPPSTTVLTGATSGIGLAAARLLAQRRGTLLLQGPERDGALPSAVRALQQGPPADRATLHYLNADFTQDGAVTSLAEQIREVTDTVDVVINNAAVPGASRRTMGAWGVEVTFGVNYLAGALLTDDLLPLMPTNGRIVNVASATHQTATLDLDDLSFDHRSYSPIAAYAQSKLAVVTNSIRLAARIPQTVMSVHPGVVSTGLLHAMFGVGGGDVTEGARNLLAAAATTAPSGSYFDERQVESPSRVALNADMQRRLHQITQELLGTDVQ
ncbi:NAD(P)-dependent dehydrogenase, short-chain alcohol dehydrogenase family [Rathayibacter oskolensis]|uniref:NAD(P)-dependent dehydrogenase, short-chain alcohol dehydrogenase family n=1 Tax=Rathayibacter oskolensis TaxID=1891671 RepID=A0A1X7P1H7_9MICO|nr:SDR family NAD(P)-dependent oxidoreductase [Rathayibacter oskolensis]SMH44000.1 NAD(P)-dependent dehydrogenase, short-chain alcohol dehydrogenase family [Rathayibacter oskolensis]